MYISPDLLLDRDKLKRQLINWRMVAFLAISILILTFLLSRSVTFDSKPSIIKKSIARITVAGIITHNQYTIEAINKLTTDNNVKAVIVHINSPGGTFVGGESLFNSLRKLSAQKPVVAVMDDLAASAGYMVATGTEYIIAHNGTITGSIGVLMETFEFTELAHKLGVKFTTFKSSPLKAAPLPTEELTPEARRAIDGIIKDMYEVFFNMVLERRKIPKAKLLQIADGRAYTGRQAATLGLVDKIGDEDDALHWLFNVKKVDSNLKIIDYAITKEISSLDKLLNSSASISTLIKNAAKNKIFSFL